MNGELSTPELMELAYRIDLPLKDWQQKLSDAIFKRRSIGTGLLSYEFDASDPEGPVGIGSIATAGDVEEFAQSTEETHNAIQGNLYHIVLKRGTHCSTTRRRLAEESHSLEEFNNFNSSIEKLGLYDIWAVCSVELNARGIAFAIPLENHIELKPAETAYWQKIAVHISAGYRLRKSLSGNNTDIDSLLDKAEAILGNDGHPIKLGKPAADKREIITRAVKAIDRARAEDYRNGSSHSIDLWKGLLAGKWSLVFRTDSDGKRFILLFKNDPISIKHKKLSRRESQIAGYAAQGHSYKDIAYELGLNVSTIGTYLQRALSKLELASIHELVWLYGELRAGGEWGKRG